MSIVADVTPAPLPLDRFRELLPDEAVDELQRRGQALASRSDHRTVWNVNSTAVGGGVAEMLGPLVGYARGAGVDARWLVIQGNPEFFLVTKRLHEALHGMRGSGLPLDEHARRAYEETLRQNADDLLALVQPEDVVILHDPQTAGLAPRLVRCGATVVWRCHVGADRANEEVAAAWAFLLPYLQEVSITVFSRRAYVPPELADRTVFVIGPSIDPFSAKNLPLEPALVRAILTFTGVVEGTVDVPPEFLRIDGSRARIMHRVDVVRLGPEPEWDTPTVVQVSRWDSLKDPIGVMEGFARLVSDGTHRGAHLLLAGPNVHAVADDPDGARVLDQVIGRWRQLPHEVRRHVHLLSIPSFDVEENAAIVNALQRHATVVVQKSLHEGFGLTVTEAMWKGRPVVASAVGGIQDQIEDGVSGLLLKDPTDLQAFAAALERVLGDPLFAARLGRNAHERVRQHYLGVRHLGQFAELIERIDAARARRDRELHPTTVPAGGSVLAAAHASTGHA